MKTDVTDARSSATREAVTKSVATFPSHNSKLSPPYQLSLDPPDQRENDLRLITILCDVARDHHLVWQQQS